MWRFHFTTLPQQITSLVPFFFNFERPLHLVAIVAIGVQSFGSCLRRCQTSIGPAGDDDDGTIKFRKPKKSKLDATKSSDGKKKTVVKEKKRKDVKAVNNSALLSFGDEEDE
jgi:hypothetical protein